MQDRLAARWFGRRIEQMAVGSARALWPLIGWIDERLPSSPLWPSWAPAPLRRGKEKSSPPLGWPRRTDSLCPRCVEEARLAAGPTGSLEVVPLPADIVERDGTVWMLKDCPRHGHFADQLSHDPTFLARLERLFPGRDYSAVAPETRNHGASTLRYGRGAVFNVDLTSRCNLRCSTCFADADHGPAVHELEWEEIQSILARSLDTLPRRQMSVQFSGGEPTLSPHFLDAVRYAREVGYFCVQCASNGIRFAQDPEFCRRARQAGLRLCYLQFDGVSNEAHLHRNVANLFDVKRRAIQNLHAAGIDVVLVATVSRGANDAEVGPIVRFAIEHAEAVTVVSFQPISFSGRDAGVSDAERHARRYTLSHLAHDLRAQLGFTEPLCDWFPLSAMNTLSDAVDRLLGPGAPLGALNCGCHPHCGAGTVLLVHKRTKQAIPITDLLDVEQLLRDFGTIADAGRGRRQTLLRMALATLRNFRPERAPAGLDALDLIRQLLSQMGASGRRIGETEGDAGRFEWRLLFVAGMWFQDLYTYDFRRTEMCIIPYGTPAGEIAFCAYNTGVGWRERVETSHSTPRAEWVRAHGRHDVYAGGRSIPLDPAEQEPGCRRRLPVFAEPQAVARAPVGRELRREPSSHSVAPADRTDAAAP
jgi:7,8-dihydro-6-hydroxymethylpterin dimethyltransferase